MKAVKHPKETNMLKAPPGADNVSDLSIARLVFDNNIPAVESCWEISAEELEIIMKTKKIYFTCLGQTHPPVTLTAESHIRKDSVKHD